MFVDLARRLGTRSGVAVASTGEPHLYGTAVQPSGARRRCIRTFIATAVTASFMVLLGFFGAHSAAAAPLCSGYGCDGRDPVQMGCDADAYTAATGYAYRSGQATLGYNGIIIDLRYSPTCGTNWTRVRFTGPGAPWVGADLEVIRTNGPRPGTDEQWIYSGPTKTLWGNMVYAPSPICAHGDATVDGWSYSWFGATPNAC
jgi:Protein of unknown function (DUF2690)